MTDSCQDVQTITQVAGMGSMADQRLRRGIVPRPPDLEAAIKWSGV